MRFNKGFTTAIHTILIVAVHSKEYKITSDIIANKIGCNPAIVRLLIGDLKQAGFLAVNAKEGTILARQLDEISLADVMRVVEPDALCELRTAYKKVAKRCPTGQYLNEILYDYSRNALDALMNELSRAN